MIKPAITNPQYDPKSELNKNFKYTGENLVEIEKDRPWKTQVAGTVNREEMMDHVVNGIVMYRVRVFSVAAKVCCELAKAVGNHFTTVDKWTVLNFNEGKAGAERALHNELEKKPICSCGNMNMASQGKDIICDECHKKCGEIPD